MDLKANRVVVLRFADGIRVDIAIDATERQAIADMTARALASDHPAELPLYEAVTSVIPDDRARALLNGEVLTTRRAAEEAAFFGCNPVPIRGIQAAMRAYGRSSIAGAAPEIIAAAERDLIEFFARYGVAVEAGDGTPNWLKEKRIPAEQVWTEPTL